MTPITFLTRDEVSIWIDAPPEAIYDLVADVTRTPEWSPEIISCEWVDGAQGPAVGARFTARNKVSWMSWSNQPVVEVAERGGSSPSHDASAQEEKSCGATGSTPQQPAPQSRSPTR